MLPKHREFCELKCILRFKDIAIFAAKSLIIILEIINHGNCHRENVWLHRGNIRENTWDLKIEFEWGHWVIATRGT